MARLKRFTGKTSGATRKDARVSGVTNGTRPSVSSLLNLQRSAGNAATGRIIGGMLVQAKPQSSTIDTPSGIESPSEETPTDVAMPEAAPVAPDADAQSETGAAPGLIVDDSVDTVAPGQMRKREYFARLRTEVGVAAEAALGGTEHAGHSQKPIDTWLASYETQGLERINRDLQRVAGDGPAPTTAEESIALIAERVRTTAATWARTGELTDLPSGLSLPGLDLAGGGGLLGGLAGLGSFGGVFFKAGPGGPREAGDPRMIQRQLGTGRPLDGTVRSRMEQALGHSFSNVRVHTDGGAADMAGRLNAKAFTVGEHVAFGAREYRPGTLVGDALLAHELAHVVQQGDPTLEDQFPAIEGGASLEADADRSALGAVTALWGGDRSVPRLRVPVAGGSSRMRLQRCAGCGGSAAAPTQRRILSASADCVAPNPATWSREVEDAGRLQGATRVDTMATLLQRALCDTGRQVAVAGGSHTDRVHPDDYEKAPVVNFDIGLNDKKGWVGDRKLSINYGYSFNRGPDEYVVLGAKSVDARSPVLSKMYMEHELFHTEHHLGAEGSRTPDADQELEAWTADFLRYFHQLRSSRMQWAPLVGYYEQASEGARSRTLEQLMAYYTNPPVPESEREQIRRSFASWLRRRLRSDEHRDARLIQDLESRLHVAGARESQP
jgi:uncharacterized protein DUF4157